MIVLTAQVAQAEGYKIGSIEIENPWSRATPAGASVAGGFLRITNKGSAPDRLIGGSSAVSDRFEIHEMAVIDGVMRMRPVKNGLEIKPGETVELKPGSYHVMMMGLKQGLQQGQKVKGTLTFEKAGTIEIEYTVEAIGGPPPRHDAPMGGMHGH